MLKDCKYLVHSSVSQYIYVRVRLGSCQCINCVLELLIQLWCSSAMYRVSYREGLALGYPPPQKLHWFFISQLAIMQKPNIVATKNITPTCMYLRKKNPIWNPACSTYTCICVCKSSCNLPFPHRCGMRSEFCVSAGNESTVWERAGTIAYPRAHSLPVKMADGRYKGILKPKVIS